MAPSPAVVSVLIDLPAGQAYHSATLDAIGHATEALGAETALDVRVVPTTSIDAGVVVAPGHGIVVGPGSPYDEPEAVLDVIGTARERGIPLVGT